jgi:hypothetical protein
MRILVLVLLLALSGACSIVPRPALTKEFLVGSWDLVGMTKEVVPVERLVDSGLLKGQLIFNADGTFSGDFIYPKSPEKNTKALGTYTVHEGILTISNQTNNSSTASELSMEKDVLIVKPLVKEGFVMYFKRAN